MIAIKSKQKKSWEEIKNIMEENGIEFVDLTDEEAGFFEVEDVANKIKSGATEQQNKKQLYDSYGYLGVFVQSLGWDENLKFTIVKEEPQEYGEEYDLTVYLETEFEDFLNEKEENLAEAVMDKIRNEIYMYSADELFIGGEVEETIEIPKRRKTYKL